MKYLKTKLTLAGFTTMLVAFYALAQSGGEKNSASASAADQPDTGNLRAFVELARSDIKTDKALIIAENLPMTDAEAVEFRAVGKLHGPDIARALLAQVFMTTTLDDTKYSGSME